jgi:glycosyltransferase involved in cell wall biosynthesis
VDVSSGEATKNVAIFRLDLFKQSETFIRAQAENYSRYSPIFLGRKVVGPVPPGATAVTLPPGAASTVKAILLKDPGPFVDALGKRLPAILHAHFSIDAAFAVPLARRLKVPLVVTLHGFDVTTRDRAVVAAGRSLPILALARRRQLQRHADLFICVSDFIRRAALSQGYPPERTIVAPLGIDLDLRRPGGEPTPGLIVHVARLVEKKGTEYLLHAFARIEGQAHDARLVIVGDGPRRLHLEALAHELGVTDRVTFTGGLDHAATLAWMRQATVVAVPSVTASSGDSEGLPTVIFEAGALARPVVASDTSGIPEAVEDGKTGFLTRERDADSIAAGLMRVLSSPELALKLGQQGRRAMEERFESSKLTAALEDRYDALVAQFQDRRHPL